MTTKTNPNGQIRRTLSDQLDRLDGMLDGLAEGLNDAVGQAVKDAVGSAVQQAVQAVLREALANPELLTRLGAVVAPAHPAAAAPAPPPPSAPAKTTWKRRWVSVGRKMTACVALVRMECSRRLGQARRGVTGVGNRLLILGRFPYSLLTAVLVAAAVGVTTWFAQPWLAAAYAAICGFAAMVAMRIRAAWGRLTMSAPEPTE